MYLSPLFPRGLAVFGTQVILKRIFDCYFTGTFSFHFMSLEEIEPSRTKEIGKKCHTKLKEKLLYFSFYIMTKL